MDNRIDFLQMASQLASQTQGQYSNLPLEQWHPQDCGNLPLTIDQEGRWWSTEDPNQPSAYRRPELVKLLSQLIWCEPEHATPDTVNAKYSLKTPHESVTIQVADVPFIIVDYRWIHENDTILRCTTHLGEIIDVGETHPLYLCQKEPQLPYVLIRRNLWARFNRNCFYRLVEELLNQKATDETEGLSLISNGLSFRIANA